MIIYCLVFSSFSHNHPSLVTACVEAWFSVAPAFSAATALALSPFFTKYQAVLTEATVQVSRAIEHEKLTRYVGPNFDW